MKASAIVSPVDSTDQFSRRTVLDLSHAVKAPRFATADHERSRIVREVLDLFTLDVPQTPRPERTVDMSESVVLEGLSIVNSLRTGDHVVRQRRVADLAAPELSIAEPFEPAPTLQADAAAALDRMATQRVRARVVARPAPAAGRSSIVWVAAAMVIAALVITAWIAVRS